MDLFADILLYNYGEISFAQNIGYPSQRVYITLVTGSAELISFFKSTRFGDWMTDCLSDWEID